MRESCQSGSMRDHSSIIDNGQHAIQLRSMQLILVLGAEANTAEQNRASFCMTKSHAYSRRRTKKRAGMFRAPPKVRCGLALFKAPRKPMFRSGPVLGALVGGTMRRPVRFDTVDQPGALQSTPASRQSDLPDSRLVELVRVLARCAAKQWYDREAQARGTPRCSNR